MINRLPLSCIATCCEYLPKNEQRETRRTSKIFDQAIFFLQRNPFHTIKAREDFTPERINQIGYQNLGRRPVGVHAKTLCGHYNPIRSGLFSPDGTTVISFDQRGRCKFWDLKTLPVKATPLIPYEAKVFCFSPDGENILLHRVGQGGSLSIFNLEMKREIFRSFPHEEEILCAAFSPDGTKTLSASRDKTLVLQNFATPSSIFLEGHEDIVYSVAFSSDGTKAVSASADTTLIVWDLIADTSEVLRGHKAAVLSVAFSPDGSKISSGSADNTIIIWDIIKKLETTLDLHNAPVLSIAFSPDGTQMVSASENNILLLWHLTKERFIFESLKKHTDSVYSASFNSEGTKIVSASADKTLLIWDLVGPEESLLKVISKQASREILPTHLHSKKLPFLIEYSAMFIANQALENVKILFAVEQEDWCRKTYIPHCLDRMRKMPRVVSDRIVEIFSEGLKT